MGRRLLGLIATVIVIAVAWNTGYVDSVRSSLSGNYSPKRGRTVVTNDDNSCTVTMDLTGRRWRSYAGTDLAGPEGSKNSKILKPFRGEGMDPSTRTVTISVGFNATGELESSVVVPDAPKDITPVGAFVQVKQQRTATTQAMRTALPAASEPAFGWEDNGPNGDSRITAYQRADDFAGGEAALIVGIGARHDEDGTGLGWWKVRIPIDQLDPESRIIRCAPESAIEVPGWVGAGDNRDVNANVGAPYFRSHYVPRNTPGRIVGMSATVEPQPEAEAADSRWISSTPASNDEIAAATAPLSDVRSSVEPRPAADRSSGGGWNL